MRPLIRINSKTADDVMSEFGAMLRSLRNSGKKVFVLLTGPTDPAFDPRFLVSRVTGKRIDAPVPVAPWRQQVGAISTAYRRRQPQRVQWCSTQCLLSVTTVCPA